MSQDDIPEMNFVDMSADFAALMENSDASVCKAFSAGDKIKGHVSMIDENSVFLEISGKSEGIIPKVEFIKDDEVTVSVGDMITAYFVSDFGGEISMTTRMSGDALEESLGVAFQNAVPVEGKVTEEKKGGFTVMLGAIRAFCPYSQMDRRTDDPSIYVGQTFTFIITKMTEYDAVVSRRPILEKESAARLIELEDTLNEGDVLSGIVRKIESFGVFVDLGGLDGLIPMGEISWQRNFDVDSIVKVGDDVEVTVRRLDWDRKRIVLSLKEANGNPWLEDLDFETGKAYKGSVTRVESYGAFVELKAGIEGLLHISKLGKGKRLAHANEVVNEGDDVEVYVLDVNAETRRISLSFEDDSHELEGHEQSGVPTGESNAISVGNTIKGSVDGIKRFGVFIKLNETKKGLLHISMFDVPPAADPLKFLTSKFSQGDELQVEVHHIEGARITLGLPGSNTASEDRKAIAGYMSNKTKESTFGSIGDVFGGLSL